MASLATIGVLGGMGPQATILFMQKMLTTVKAGDDGDHIPLLVDNNTQVPSRIRAILENGDGKPGKTLARMARRLEYAGANALVMPCNTAHHYIDEIEEGSEVPFINMVSLSANHAKRMSSYGDRIGVLGSPALRKAAVFENSLQNANLIPVYSENEEEILNLIRCVKASGPSPQLGEDLNKIAKDLVHSKANAVMICCSEFSVLAEYIAIEVPIFDTLDILVNAAAQFARTHAP